MDRGRRYKERGLQFASSEDSRALRAVESQVGRKARRDAILSHRRMYESEECRQRKETSMHRKLVVADLQPVMTTKKNEKELELQRYKDLLAWKEGRRKKLAVEKRRRKPSFKTGVFLPDQPKFLVSDDVKVMDSKQCTPAKPTPFKYLERSSSKYGFTPGTSMRKVPRFCSGITPVATVPNVHKFSLRTTPSSSSGMAAMLTRKRPEQKENFPGSSCGIQNTNIISHAKRKSKTSGEVDMKRILRGRSNRRLKVATDNEDLGVKALPKTPRASQKNFLDSEKAKYVMPSLGSSSMSLGCSFAPDNFSFTFKTSSSGEPRPEIAEKLKESFNANNSLEEEDNDALAQECANFRAPDANCKEDEDLISKSASKDTALRLELFKKDDGFVSASRRSSRKSKTLDISNLEAKTLLTGSCDLVEDNFVVETAVKSPGVTKDDKLEGDFMKNEVTNMELEEETVSVTENAESVKDADDYFSQDYKTILRHDAKMMSPKLAFEKSNTKTVTDTTSPEVEGSVSTGLETPLPLRRRSARISKRLSSCTETMLTPLMSRLRPRTPCSRSTRRSLSAHCDFVFEVKATPCRALAKKRSRQSTNIVTKMIDNKESLVPFKLDEEIDKTSLLIKDNLVIEEENEDQAATSALGGGCLETQHKNVAEPDLVKEDLMMQSPKQDDILTPCGSRHRGKVSWMIHDSPYVNSEKRSKSRRSEVPDDMRGLFDDIPTDGSPLPTHLLPLLVEGRKIQQAMSPSQPAGEVNSSPGEEQKNLLKLLEFSAPPERTDSPEFDVWGEESPDKVRDSIQFDSLANTDAVVPVPNPVTRKKSSRISLLPGMSKSPLATDKLSVINEDLISWDTPVASARKIIREHLETPRRRSKRLSKACPE